MNNDILFYKIKCIHEHSEGHKYNSFVVVLMIQNDQKKNIVNIFKIYM